MAKAQQEFTDRIKSLRDACQLPTLQPLPIAPDSDKQIARLLRNGAAVIGYCCLEDFFRNRASEIADIVCAQSIPFKDLPSALQRAGTEDAIKAVAFRANLAKKRGEDSEALIQEHSHYIASTRGSGYQLSPFSFASGRSNLELDDVGAIAKCFHVHKLWDQVALVAPRLGYGGMVDFKQELQDAIRERHAAAHAASHDTEIAHLLRTVDNAIAIAASWDLLLTVRARELGDTKAKHSDPETVHKRIDLRVIEMRQDGSFAEREESKRHAFRVSQDVDKLIADALSRAKSKNQILVRFTPRGQVSNWFV